jgi:hypothetical protein
VKLPAAAHSEAGTPARQLSITIKDDGAVADETLKYGEVMGGARLVPWRGLRRRQAGDGRNRCESPAIRTVIII